MSNYIGLLNRKKFNYRKEHNLDDYIYPNQVIMLPVSGYSYYVTAEGDTLNSVSDIFKKNIQEVVKENETIYLLPGQILVSQRK